MKILHVINSLDKGGAERLLINFLPELSNVVTSVSVLLLDVEKSEVSYIDALRKHNIKIEGIKSLSIYSPYNVWELFKYFRTNKFDLIHVHLFPAIYWVSIAMRMLSYKKRSLLIFTEHSTQNRRFNNRIFKPIDRIIYNGYSKIIAISPAIKVILDLWIGQPEKNIVIRNGLDINRFINSVPYPKDKFYATLNLPANAFTMLMSARFLYPKKQLLLIEVLEKLPSNIHLLFAGIGDDIAICKELTSKLILQDRVHYLGFRNDIAQLMKSVDLNILATEYEGMSGVTLEALASGKPFLGSDVPGVNDIVPDDSFLFKNNVQSLTEKITAIEANQELNRIMCEKGIKFAKQFDISKMILEHCKLYNSLIINKILD